MMAADTGQRLYSGAAGIALERIELARAGLGTWDAVHPWTAAMTRTPVTANPDSSGLYQGAPAVAFVLHAAGHPSYASVLAALDRHVDSSTQLRLERAHERIKQGRRPVPREYDLIGGLTGLGVYLMRRDQTSVLLRDVLRYLVALTEPIDALPGWWCDEGPDVTPSPRWLGGHGNLGLAHGIAGPLALLSCAMECGIRVTGHREAIGRIVVWLDQWQQGSGRAAWWPGAVARSEERGGRLLHAASRRPSWCYGTPGLARAQQLAGFALHDAQRRQAAEDALAGCLADSGQLVLLTDLSLCHGWAGVVQATWRVGRDAKTTEIADLVQSLRISLEKLTGTARPDTDGSLLDGTAGIRLALHTTNTTKQPVTRWDACLLLDRPASTLTSQTRRT